MNDKIKYVDINVRNPPIFRTLANYLRNLGEFSSSFLFLFLRSPLIKARAILFKERRPFMIDRRAMDHTLAFQCSQDLRIQELMDLDCQQQSRSKRLYLFNRNRRRRCKNLLIGHRSDSALVSRI